MYRSPYLEFLSTRQISLFCKPGSDVNGPKKLFLNLSPLNVSVTLLLPPLCYVSILHTTCCCICPLANEHPVSLLCNTDLSAEVTDRFS